MSQVAFIDSYERIAIYRTVLASAIYSFHESWSWQTVLADTVVRMLHAFCTGWIVVLLVGLIPVRVGDDWSVDDYAGITLDAAEVFDVGALGLQSSLSSSKDSAVDSTTTDVYQGGKILREHVVVVLKFS